MVELERLADEAEREFNAGKTLPIEQLCQPTQGEKCADLAQATGWTVNHDCLLHPTSRVCWSSHDGLFKHKDFPPNPFTSADDSRALVLWLAEDDERWHRYFIVLEKLIDTPRERTGQTHPQGLFYAILRSFVAAPLPVIAEAAWKAIQEKQ